MLPYCNWKVTSALYREYKESVQIKPKKNQKNSKKGKKKVRRKIVAKGILKSLLSIWTCIK